MLHFTARHATRVELDRFASARAAAPSVGGGATRSLSTPRPDFHLWSPHAVQAWQSAQSTQAPAPLGIIRVVRLGLEAPILEGSDDRTLERAVGHIEDTAAPGSPGNSGLAGHRDGFFRALKDIGAGDAIEIESLQGTTVYRVDRTWIVNPDDVSVLDPTPAPSITLVTCYPFYFVGSAPQRFIVRATRTAPPPERGD